MLKFGLIVAVIGIGVVFSILILLIACIKLLGYILDSTNKQAKQPSLPTPHEAIKADESEEEVVAVIAAALAYMQETEQAENNFYRNNLIIKNIKRIPEVNAPTWSLAARKDAMNMGQLMNMNLL